MGVPRSEDTTHLGAIVLLIPSLLFPESDPTPALRGGCTNDDQSLIFLPSVESHRSLGVDVLDFLNPKLNDRLGFGEPGLGPGLVLSKLAGVDGRVPLYEDPDPG